MNIVATIKFTQAEVKKMKTAHTGLNDMHTIADTLQENYVVPDSAILKDGKVTLIVNAGDLDLPIDSTINQVQSFLWDYADGFGTYENFQDSRFGVTLPDEMPCLFEEKNSKITKHNDGGITVVFKEEYPA